MLIEVDDGIKRVYIPELKFKVNHEISYFENKEILKIYLNKEFKLNIKEIQRCDMAEERFGHYIYYKEN